MAVAERRAAHNNQIKTGRYLYPQVSAIGRKRTLLTLKIVKEFGKCINGQRVRYAIVMCTRNIQQYANLE